MRVPVEQGESAWRLCASLLTHGRVCKVEPFASLLNSHSLFHTSACTSEAMPCVISVSICMTCAQYRNREMIMLLASIVRPQRGLSSKPAVFCICSVYVSEIPFRVN